MTATRADRHPTAYRVARILCVSAFLEATGSSLFGSASTLFFLRYAHLSATELGAGLLAAGLAGTAFVLPAGWAAHRVPPFLLVAALQAAAAAVFVGYRWMHGFLPFLLLVTATRVMERCTPVVRNSAIAACLPPSTRVAVRSRTRVAYNAGVALGTLAVAPVLAADNATWYRWIGPANGMTLAMSATLTLLLRRVTGQVLLARGRWRLPRPQVLATIGCNSVLRLHDSLLLVAAPAWIAFHTNVPPVTYSALLMLNSGTVILTQHRVSRRSRTVADGASGQRQSGALVAAGCLVFATAPALPRLAAVAILVAGTLMLTAGELVQLTSEWTLSYALAEDQDVGLYQALFSYSAGLQEMLGPLVVLSLTNRLLWAGWLGAGAATSLAGVISTRLLSRSEVARRNDPSPHATEGSPGP